MSEVNLQQDREATCDKNEPNTLPFPSLVNFIPKQLLDSYTMVQRVHRNTRSTVVHGRKPAIAGKVLTKKDRPFKKQVEVMEEDLKESHDPSSTFSLPKDDSTVTRKQRSSLNRRPTAVVIDPQEFYSSSQPKENSFSEDVTISDAWPRDNSGNKQGAGSNSYFPQALPISHPWYQSQTPYVPPYGVPDYTQLYSQLGGLKVSTSSQHINELIARYTEAENDASYWHYETPVNEGTMFGITEDMALRGIRDFEILQDYPEYLENGVDEVNLKQSNEGCQEIANNSEVNLQDCCDIDWILSDGVSPSEHKVEETPIENSGLPLEIADWLLDAPLVEPWATTEGNCEDGARTVKSHESSTITFDDDRIKAGGEKEYQNRPPQEQEIKIWPILEPEECTGENNVLATVDKSQNNFPPIENGSEDELEELLHDSRNEDPFGDSFLQ